MMTLGTREESAFGYKVVDLGDVRFGSLAAPLVNISLMAASGRKADVQACGLLRGVASWTGNKDGSGGVICTVPTLPTRIRLR